MATTDIPEETTDTGDDERISLRAFQNELAVRIATRSDVAEEASLGIMAANRRFLCRLNGINEILFPSPITAVPLTRPWFLGLTNVRGNLHSVIDFSLFLGERATVVNADTRLILFNQAQSAGSLNLALMVQQVYGLRNFSGYEAKGAEKDDLPWITQNWEDADGKRWSELDLTELALDPAFQHIGR